jgi:predicted enzyme related to lactoylglutathione lyase
MLSDSKAFSGFAVDDLDKAEEFYGETLDLKVERVDPPGLLGIHHPDGHDTMIYPKDDFQPATYTVLNFSVEDVDAAVDGLTSKGVSFERYEGFDQDEKGISRGQGPTIAWFKDPAGNILAVLNEG